jgi:TonB family protein
MVAPTDSEGVFETVEQPARALAGNPHPDYPSLLRSANVTGQVSARFVVDTLGRVEQGSIAFEPGSDVLFESSVRRALLASRYSPAMTSGRRVRMLVRQDFAFRLTP